MPDPGSPAREVDVLVVGGGQAGLAAGYYLRRAGLAPHTDYVILDAGPGPGGAWSQMWPSLRAFSPPEYSSLPGWLMPAWAGDDGFPPAGHVAGYLTRYEARYDLPVRRPVRVRSVIADGSGPGGRLRVRTSDGDLDARAVISATGTFSRPFVPFYRGAASFAGRQLHTAGYREAGEFTGQRVLVVGGGNSAAQLLAEISTVAAATWVTLRPPRFLPDEVDGRVLFQVATARRRALDAGQVDPGGVSSLGDVVMVASVKAARDRGVLHAEPMFDHLTPDGAAWADGTHRRYDAIVWCTGFRPALAHLSGLGLRTREGHIATVGTQAAGEPRLHLLGYGDWTGPGSATLIGVGRPAREAVAAATAHLAATEDTAARNRVRVTIQFFDGCPSWQTARRHLEEAARRVGVDVDVQLERVETPEEAQRLGFTGSPTLLIEGADPFAQPGAVAALSCRMYPTPAGPAGAPTVEQLSAALLEGLT